MSFWVAITHQVVLSYVIKGYSSRVLAGKRHLPLLTEIWLNLTRNKCKRCLWPDGCEFGLEFCPLDDQRKMCAL